MRVAFTFSLIAVALAAFAGDDARAGKPAPRLCERMAINTTAQDRSLRDPLQDAARALALRLVRLDPAIEHGAIFYRNANGHIRTGDIAVGDERAVQLAIDVRPGEAVVGALHTHARSAYYNGDQSKLSHEDIELGELLLALPETDRDLRLFIVDVRSATMAQFAAAGRCAEQWNRNAQR